METMVRDVMTRDPITIDPEAPVATAVAAMQEQKVRHLPVQDDAGRLVGLVTDRDLRCALFAPAIVDYLSASARRRRRGAGEALENLRLRAVMTWDPLTTGPDVPVARAAARMLEHRVGCLPVVEAGKLVGIVTERDVLRALAGRAPAARGVDPAFLW